MDFHFGRGPGEDVSILIAEANLHDLIECLDAHGSGIHSQTATEVARYSFHPLKPCNIRRSRQCAELFEFHAHTRGDLCSIHFVPLEVAAREVCHHAGDAAIAHKKVRAATHDHERDVFIKAVPD